MIVTRFKRTLSCCILLSCLSVPVRAQDIPRLHPPITQDTRNFTPRPYTYVEPQPLNLPSAANLKTITIKDRNYEITRVAPQTRYSEAEDAARVEKEGVAVFQNPNEALTFVGTGGAGRHSQERLVVEDCTFVVDFKEGDFTKWDERRCAIFVKGYNEVLIRNCVFLVKGVPGEPVRRTMASVGIYDSLKIQIENCYFEGLTNWMRGHVTIFDSGRVHIKGCEVSGTRINGRSLCGGGLWIANGVGEGKLGTAQTEANRIYPSGPLLIENCWVHDQQGRENTDGIYVQSIHPYLIRNCKVEKWGSDGLLDLGYRDSARGTYNGKPLINHGGVGVVENCEFAEGYVKCSVGLGGGLIFRNNLLRNTWLYPYVFDGGSWHVLNNRFTEQRSVLLSGRDHQTGGWSAKEGMLINGSKMYWYGNVIENKAGQRALFVSSTIAHSTLKDNVLSDYNFYNLEKPPAVWADDQAAATKYVKFEDWRTATGNDKNSILGPGIAGEIHPTDLTLPGNLTMQWRGPTGTQQPFGISNKAVLQKAATLRGNS